MATNSSIMRAGQPGLVWAIHIDLPFPQTYQMISHRTIEPIPQNYTTEGSGLGVMALKIAFSVCGKN
jgi:hypothetical protein